jgi:ribosomal protein L37E
MTNTSSQIEGNKEKKWDQIIINDLSVCEYCYTTGLSETDKFCPSCGFPQRGTQTEMKKFIWTIENKREILATQKKAINKARNILYILAAINLIFGFIVGFLSDINLAIIISGTLTAIIFYALAEWSEKDPFPAILCGFFVYIAFIIMSAFADPNTLYQGLIIKIFIITWFIYGFKGAVDSRKLDKDLQSIRKVNDLKSEK